MSAVLETREPSSAAYNTPISPKRKSDYREKTKSGAARLGEERGGGSAAGSVSPRRGKDGEWRRGRDSNPGSTEVLSGFRDHPVRPLRHLSAAGPWPETIRRLAEATRQGDNVAPGRSDSRREAAKRGGPAPFLCRERRRARASGLDDGFCKIGRQKSWDRGAALSRRGRAGGVRRRRSGGTLLFSQGSTQGCNRVCRHALGGGHTVRSPPPGGRRQSPGS